jgi:hypothetical protein
MTNAERDARIEHLEAEVERLTTQLDRDWKLRASVIATEQRRWSVTLGELNTAGVELTDLYNEREA